MKAANTKIVLADPPFGKKSSVTIVNEAGETSKESLIINRDDSERARASASRTLLKQADVHTLLRLPTGILIRSLPLAQPSAFPSH